MEVAIAMRLTRCSGGGAAGLGCEAVIDELTSQTPSQLPAYAVGDRKLRIEGGGNLHRAALACGVRRYIQQSS